MTLPDEVLETDVLGRVRVKKARREALLDEFERGGTSGQAFAKLVGIQVPDVRVVDTEAPEGAQALPTGGQDAAVHPGRDVAVDGSGGRAGRRQRGWDVVRSSARWSATGVSGAYGTSW